MSSLGCAFVAAGLAGFSRGFAAFGTAMIYVPLVTLAYDAKTAAVTLFLVDILPAIPMIWKAAPRCDRHTLSWMALGAVALTPIGVALLLVADPVQSQLVLGIILLPATSYMLFNKGTRIHASPLRSVAAGAVSGLAGGVCGIFGPPAMIYLIGRSSDARDARADTLVYLTLESIVLGLTYLIYGMYPRWYLELSLILMPVYGLCLWLGSRRFSRTSEGSYRRVILCLLWALPAAVVTRSAFALFR